jgi:hypothetical protein
VLTPEASVASVWRKCEREREMLAQVFADTSAFAHTTERTSAEKKKKRKREHERTADTSKHERLLARSLTLPNESNNERRH